MLRCEPSSNFLSSNRAILKTMISSASEKITKVKSTLKKIIEKSMKRSKLRGKSNGGREGHHLISDCKSLIRSPKDVKVQFSPR